MADATKILEIVIQAKDEATKTLKSFGDDVKKVTADTKAGAIALSALGAGTVILGKQFVEAAGYVQVQRTAMKTLIGDAQLAEKTYRDLVDMAAKTPFEIPQILEQSKRLIAMGVEAKDLTKTFGMLGDVASGVGMEKLPQLVLAFGQISAKGRLMGTELRQLTEAGFNLADAMGVSNAKLDEMIENKEVGFEQVRKAFETVTAEGGRFHGLMGELAKTTPGQLSNLSDNVFKLKAALGDALLPTVNELLKVMIPLIQKFADFATAHPNIVLGVMAITLALGALGATFLIIGPVISAVTGIVAIFSSVITFATSVVGALIAILGGPLTIIILAIIAIGAMLALAWKNNWFGIRDVVSNVVNWFNNTALPNIKKWFDDIIAKVNDFVEKWKARFEVIKNAVMSVVHAISDLINKAREAASLNFGGGGGGGRAYQHGGFVDAPYGQAVPAILHGGERIIPRSGTDVNGGGISVSISFTGPVNMDSTSRVEELADMIGKVLGRQNELATKGLAI